MSYDGYQQYGGNPYSQAEAGYGGSNPYEGTGGGYGVSNPYGSTNDQGLSPPPPLQHETSNYSQGSQYSTPSAQQAYPEHQGRASLSQQDFLARIDGTKSGISHLTSNIGEIANIHQRLLSSPDDSSSSRLESIVTDTQIRNTQIKDEIKYLERDAAKEPSDSFKKTQVESLKRTFKTQLEDFQREEADYSKRYREAIARQYRIINPEASETEVQEAANADWGDEGIFQQALRSNRSGHASSVLSNVRARHDDILRIERTMIELAELFNQLNEVVVAQDPVVQRVEQQAEQVATDATKANEQLDQGVKSARRARKLKWWTLGVVIAIIAIIALALGLYFGLRDNGDNNQGQGQGGQGGQGQGQSQ